MPFSGAALAYSVAGGLILFSGIKGATLSDTVKGALTGNLGNVKTVPQPATGTGTGTVSDKGTAATPAGPDETSWINAFLQSIGAPATTANVSSISSWIAHEGPYGTQGQNNPLNTTESEPGATSFDGLAVKDYPSPAEGIQATAATIEGGNYGDILMALRSGNGLCGRSWQGLATWSDNGYSQVC